MEPQYQGNKELLKMTLTAFLASRTVQTNRVMTCYDWATSLDAETDCVVSGFQSPIEKDVLHFLLKKKIPVIVVLARSLYKNIPEELQEAFDAGRVLFISISNNPRNSNAAGKQRNQYVTELAQQTVFGMLSEQSSLYDLYLKFKENRRNVVIL